MYPSLVTHLQFDGSEERERFELEIFHQDPDGHVMEGVIRGAGGVWYPILEGVPCLLRGDLRPDFAEFAKLHSLNLFEGATGALSVREQGKTKVTFDTKWDEIPNYAIAGSERNFVVDWYVKKLGVASVDELRAYYRGKRRILEVGPGSGFNVRFMIENTPGLVFALDISTGARATFCNNREFENCHAVQGDLMDAPFADNYFDFIMADGVLHHTPNTKAAVAALYQKLAPGGQFFFYVYKKMGPARQFVDAHIRSIFKDMTTEECIRACEPLTELGRELSRLDAKVTLEKPIDVLGIPAGTHDVQRLIYYNFVKCFWNDDFDYKTNNIVNYDWYHPNSAFQHTQAEVEGWLDELGVADYQFNDANPNGLSVLLTKLDS
jgi:SAM-dependent methyltransferase/uncharacterized protein YbaR (Trm112 family)